MGSSDIFKLVEEVSRFLEIEIPPSKIRIEEIPENGDFLATLEHIFRKYVLPPILPEPVEREIVYFFLYKFLEWRGDKDLSRRIIGEWKSSIQELYGKLDRPLEEFGEHKVIMTVNGHVYIPFMDFMFYDRVLEGRYLHILLQEIRNMRGLVSRRISIDDFGDLNISILSDHPYVFDHRDIKILECLAQNPELSDTKLARMLGVSLSTVNRRLKEMERNLVYKTAGFINFEKLGLRQILVFVPHQVHTFPESPLSYYLRTVHRIFGENEGALISLIVPKDHMLDAVMLLRREYGNIDAYLVTEVGYSISFRFYDVDSRKWNINFRALSLFIRGLIEEPTYADIIRPPTYRILKGNSSEPQMRLTRTDLRILQIFSENFNTPLRHIAKMLGTYHQYIMRRKEEFLKNRIITPYISLLPARAGIPEVAIIVVDDHSEETIKALETGLMELPKVWIYKVKSLTRLPTDLQRIFWLELPKGSMIEMSKYLCRVLDRYIEYRIYFKVGYTGSRLLLADAWNEESQSWIW